MAPAKKVPSYIANVLPRGVCRTDQAVGGRWDGGAYLSALLLGGERGVWLALPVH